MNSQKIASQTGISLAEETIQAFQARLQGTIILPGDPDYDGARRVWNAMIDKHPALIAHCADAADVTTAVNLARDQGIPAWLSIWP